MDDDRQVPSRRDGRVIIHFDYDCFYASVFEAKNPSLKSLPFAVQQKQIIVTCNYEARRRGLHKMQLIRDAKRVCPDVVIALGEDISPFRDASKALYNFIRAYSWNGQVERLGFDEVWMDVTDIVDYNMETINRRSLAQSFFQVSRDDPTQGFVFDGTTFAGHQYPDGMSPALPASDGGPDGDELTLRLRLGSHLALHVRHQLEQHMGYTSTVGIATSKLLSKLVGNVNKPKGQTTLMPPLATLENGGRRHVVNVFMDQHEVGKVPGIGFKLAKKLREFVLQRPAAVDAGYLVLYGGIPENVTVADVRQHPGVNPETLERLLAGPGSPHGIGYKVWCLLHGIDETEVSHARAVPRQISIEDSYLRLDTFPEVLKELTALAKSLVTRMRIDLLRDVDDDDSNDENDGHDDDNGDVEDAHHNSPRKRSSSSAACKKWLAHPKTLRLTTRPRAPLQPDGTRLRSSKRISHSGPLPTFVFGVSESVDALAERLVRETLVTMFRKLHPDRSSWNLSLVNLAVANMAEAASDSKTASGRDIGSMFRRQEAVLKDFQVSPDASSAAGGDGQAAGYDASNPTDEGVFMTDDHDENGWDDEGGMVRDHDDIKDDDERCVDCGMRMPAFAMKAHRRFHAPT